MTGVGIFIAFEGGDGAGKSSQVALLADAFEHVGREVVRTRQPGGTELGAQIRELLLHGDHVSPRAEALLFAADKAHHADLLIRPALTAGQVVVCDRYVDSSVAYQGAGRGLGERRVAELSLWATHDLVPDITVLLDVAPSVGLGRAADANRMEAEPEHFHADVRAAFLRRAAADPQRYLVVAAEQPPEQLAEQVLATVLGVLGLGERVRLGEELP